MLVQNSGLGSDLLLISLSGNENRGIIVVSVALSVEVKESAEGGRVGKGGVLVFIEDIASVFGSLSLRDFNKRLVKTYTVYKAADSVIVRGLGIGGLGVSPVNLMNIESILIPVRGISFKSHRVLGGSIGAKEGSAVSDRVLILAIGVSIGILYRLKFRAELAASGLKVGSAHGSEGTVTHHGGEIRNNLFQCVFESIVINRLNAYLGEISVVAVDIISSAHDNITDKVLRAALGVTSVLHASNEIVSGKIGNLTTLRIYPLNALAKVEGIGKAVLGNVVAGSDGGLLSVLYVVLEKSVIGVYKELGVIGGVGSQNVPSGKVGRVVVALLHQERYSSAVATSLYLAFITSLSSPVMKSLATMLR